MEIPPRLKITMTDITRAGHCGRGTKTWFANQGLDFRDFLKNGITARKLAAKGDGLALQVIARKLADRGDG